MNRLETLDGYLVDIACVRRSPVAELLERARIHGRDCALMGHCVESGCALIDDGGGVALLDTEATPMVVDAVRGAASSIGIRLKVTRESAGDDMRTLRVEVV